MCLKVSQQYDASQLCLVPLLRWIKEQRAGLFTTFGNRTDRMGSRVCSISDKLFHNTGAGAAEIEVCNLFHIFTR